MTRAQTFATQWESASFAFASGFSAHAHTSASLGLLAGTLAVCGLVVRSAARHRMPSAPARAAIVS